MDRSMPDFPTVGGNIPLFQLNTIDLPLVSFLGPNEINAIRLAHGMQQHNSCNAEHLRCSTCWSKPDTGMQSTCRMLSPLFVLMCVCVCAQGEAISSRSIKVCKSNLKSSSQYDFSGTYMTPCTVKVQFYLGGHIHSTFSVCTYRHRLIVMRFTGFNSAYFLVKQVCALLRQPVLFQICTH